MTPEPLPERLPERLARYIELRRALGFTATAEQRLLTSFVDFVQARVSDGPVTARLALDWACSNAPRCGPAGAAGRLSIARGFLKHLRASIPETEVPGNGLLARAHRRLPYILSDRQVVAILTEARKLGPQDSLRPLTVATAFGLLASCGLRVGEVRRLRLVDVALDQTPPHLHVLRSKFHKSRLVPLHPSAARALTTYAQERRRLGCDELCDRFFVTRHGAPLDYQTLARPFLRIVRKLGMRGPAPGAPGVSLHHLRHTFAVSRLVAWQRAGVDVQSHFPTLSAYLGHARPEDTYWYLTATPQLLSPAADLFEDFHLNGDKP